MPANAPDVGGDAVVLSAPGTAAVDGLPVDLQPPAYLPQTLLIDGRDPPVVRWAHIHQQVPTAGHSLHQSLFIEWKMPLKSAISFIHTGDVKTDLDVALLLY